MKTLSYNWKILLLSVLTVALLGQSLTAAASSCAMMQHGDTTSPVQSPMPAMEPHDHAMHVADMDMGMEHPSHQGDSGCCSGAGYCSMLSCVSVVALLDTAFGLALAPNAWKPQSAPIQPNSGSR